MPVATATPPKKSAKTLRLNQAERLASAGGDDTRPWTSSWDGAWSFHTDSLTRTVKLLRQSLSCNHARERTRVASRQQGCAQVRVGRWAPIAITKTFQLAAPLQTAREHSCANPSVHLSAADVAPYQRPSAEKCVPPSLASGQGEERRRGEGVPAACHANDAAKLLRAAAPPQPRDSPMPRLTRKSKGCSLRRAGAPHGSFPRQSARKAFDSPHVFTYLRGLADCSARI